MRFTYDGYGRVVQVRDPSLNIWQTDYDLVNRVTRSAGPVAADTTTYRYDALYLTSVTDALGQVYQFAPNALGWIEIRTDPAGAQEQYRYDKHGNLTTWINRRGQTVSFTYDELDRVLTRTADGATCSASGSSGLFSVL